MQTKMYLTSTKISVDYLIQWMNMIAIILDINSAIDWLETAQNRNK